ncbi:hypothetical protein BN903_504 [Halorubrum sp. AJ67]|nr:hypothetical protein BN903_504 [Halorubrum sp. AJ67]
MDSLNEANGGLIPISQGQHLCRIDYPPTPFFQCSQTKGISYCILLTKELHYIFYCIGNIIIER